MTKRKKPYFPNHLPALLAAPASIFEPLEFDCLMDWKIGGYQLPASIACVIRVRDLKKDKTKEYIYRRTQPAKNFVRKLLKSGDYEFTIANHEAVHFFSTRPNSPEYHDEREDFFDDDETAGCV